MPERCKVCGEVYDDFLDAVLNGEHQGPFERVEVDDGS